MTVPPQLSPAARPAPPRTEADERNGTGEGPRRNPTGALSVRGRGRNARPARTTSRTPAYFLYFTTVIRSAFGGVSGLSAEELAVR